MDSMQITVLETYDSNFCCVCTQNAGTIYLLNIFKNVIVYRQVCISLAQIINETLSYNVQQSSGQFQDICKNCKDKIVEFYIFKRRNEEARAIFTDSTEDACVAQLPVRNMLLKVVDKIDDILSIDTKCLEESQHEDDEATEFNDDEQLVEEDLQEEFLDATEIEAAETYEETNEESNLEESQNSNREPSEISEDQVEDCGDVSQDISYDQIVLVEESYEPTVGDGETSSAKKKSARERHPETWIRNKRKLAKNKGQSYVSSNGKMVEAKQMKANCGPTCRMQCFLKMTEENRLENFQNFYQLADIAKQRKFLFDHMKTYVPKRTKSALNPTKVRAVQRCYFLDLFLPNKAKELLQVCKLMFLNTFSISSQMIDTLHRKANNEGEFSDTRGKFERTHSKSLEFCTQHIKEHRKTDKNVPVTKLYGKYLAECHQTEVEALDESSYRAEHSKIHLLKRQKLSFAVGEVDEQKEAG